MILAGIDAGGTKTEAIIMNERGDLLATSKGGPANFQTIGPEEAAKEIGSVYHRALAMAKKKRAHLLGIGLAGAGRPNDLNSMESSLLFLKAETMYLTNDGAIATLGAHGGSPGLILIASTGSILYGMTEDGGSLRRGGWGPILGDEGSGFWMGLMAMKASIKAEEGRGERTQLVERIKERFCFKELEDLISFTYQERLPRREIASLAVDVLEVAEEGDSIAQEIVHQGIQELVDLVSGVFERGLFHKKIIAVSGGLFQSNHFKESFKKSLREKGLRIRVKDPLYSPVYGALFYALLRARLPVPIFIRRMQNKNYPAKEIIHKRRNI